MLRDLRYAVRSCIRQPGFTIAAVLTIAIGIAANTTIFSVVNGVLLRPLPYPEGDRLVMLWEIFPAAGLETVPPSVPDYLDYRDQARTLSSAALLQVARMALTGSGEPVQPRGMAVSPSLLPMLGARTALGRVFRSDEEEPGKSHVVILSHGFWQSRFGGDHNVVGRKVTLNDLPYEVVGVLARDFEFPPPITFSGRMIVQEPPEIWMPFEIDRGRLDRGGHSYFMLAKLAPGASVAQAAAEMDALEKRITEREPDEHGGLTGAHVVPLREQGVATMRALLLVLTAAVACVLLVACVNVANLLLARATARRREFAVRLAVGAGRWRIVRQLLTESLVLAGVAGALGLVLGAWMLSLLRRFPPIELPAMYEPRLDPAVVLFSLAITVVTPALFGVLPALQSSRRDVQSALREGRTTAGGGSSRLRAGLIVAEMAIALVLLVGAGLTIRSFGALSAVEPGFNPRNVVALNVQLSPSRYRDPAQYSIFYGQVLDRLRALPGVERAAGGQFLPLTPSRDGGNYAVRGQVQPEGSVLIADRLRVTPDYFSTMGVRLVSGRVLTEDDGATGQRVAVINETLARRHWAGRDPIGQQFGFGSPEDDDWITIVGVAADVHREGLEAGERPAAYLPVSQQPTAAIWFLLRTAGDPRPIVLSAKQVVWSVDPTLPVTRVRALTELVDEAVRRPRFAAIVLTLFGAVGLLLAAVGLYGVMAFDVTRQTRELGVRLALGADPSSLVRMLLRRGLFLAGLGVLVGLIAALAVGRVMSSVLFGVHPNDPTTLILVVLLLVAVAVLASIVPARRATTLDPLVALRAE